MVWIKRILYRIRSLFSKKESKRSDVKLEKKFLNNDIYIPFILEYLQQGKTDSVTILARGYSMRPFIEHERDDLIFALSDSVKERDVVLAEIRKGHFVCHRVEKIQGNQITLRGDGNISGTELCTLDDVRAKLIRVDRKKVCFLKSCNLNTSRFWKIYSRIWPSLLPVRRYLLALNKILFLHQLPDRVKRLFKK